MKKIVKSDSKVKVEIKKPTTTVVERLTFTLTDDENLAHRTGKVHTHSPLGKCILGQKVGFEGQYAVLNENLTVKIIEIN